MSEQQHVRADGTVTFLPHRLNRHPVVVRGLTADELWICCGLSGAAGLLVGASFPELAYSAKIAEIRALPEAQAEKVLSAIGAAYAKDVLTFGHVADLARTFDVDLRDVWQVDKTFLERYTKDELRFIAQECGLVAHVSEKAFAKLLSAKKADLIAGMLNATGFDWAGRLPSSMTLDGQYGPPPVPAQAEEPLSRQAA